MTVYHGDSGDAEGTASRMTCVFACDVRSLKSNPHKINTPFGRALIIADGDLAADIDVKNDCIEALEARLQSAEYVVETARKLLNAEGELTVNGIPIPEDLWLVLNLDITAYDEAKP